MFVRSLSKVSKEAFGCIFAVILFWDFLGFLEMIFHVS